MDGWIYTTTPKHDPEELRAMYPFAAPNHEHHRHCPALKLSIPPVDRPFGRFRHP